MTEIMTLQQLSLLPRNFIKRKILINLECIIQYII